MITVYILACGSFSCCLNHFSAMSVTLNEIPPKLSYSTYSFFLLDLKTVVGDGELFFKSFNFITQTPDGDVGLPFVVINFTKVFLCRKFYYFCSRQPFVFRVRDMNLKLPLLIDYNNRHRTVLSPPA